MAGDQGRRYHTIVVDGLDAPRGERIALAVLQADGTLGVQPTGRGRSVLTHQYRPTWALVACICTVWIAGLGLLFLLVKRETSGDLTVSEGPRGAVVTVPPVVNDELRAALEAQLRIGQVPAVEPTAASQLAVPAPSAAAPPPSHPAAPPPASPAANPGSGQAPAPTPAGSRSVRGDRSSSGLDDGTVARTDAASEVAPSYQQAHQQAPPPAPSAPPPPVASPAPPAPAPAAASPATPEVSRLEIRFPAGTLYVDEGETVILGRDPSDRPGARGVAVPGDASTLSKAHALVRFVGATVEIQDLNSKNGTQVGDDPGSLPAGTTTTIAVPTTITLGALAGVVTSAEAGSAHQGRVQ